MSSLGRTVADVAPEINNPISFIYSNLTLCDRSSATSDYTQFNFSNFYNKIAILHKN
ncbi:MAG TPA: hypothetical protein V6C85_17390 [Allocoleopsis sp.]